MASARGSFLNTGPAESPLPRGDRLPRAPAPKSQTPTLVAALLGDLGFPAITTRQPQLSEQCKDHQVRAPADALSAPPKGPPPSGRAACAPTGKAPACTRPTSRPLMTFTYPATLGARRRRPRAAGAVLLRSPTATVRRAPPPELEPRPYLLPS